MSHLLPALSPRDTIRALQRAGFYIDRTSGRHDILKNPITGLRVTVPRRHHTKDLKRGTLLSIIKQAGITIEDFIKLL